MATPIAVGMSEHWMEFKGALKPETFSAVAYDNCDSLRRLGVEQILIVNGHVGNSPLGKEMEAFREKLGIDVQFCSYWQAYPEEFVKAQM